MGDAVGYRRVWRTLVASLCVAVLVGASAWASLAVMGPGGRVAAIWPGNGLLLALLLRAPLSRAPAYLLAGLLGTLTANLLRGDSGAMALALAGCDSVEVLVAASLLHPRGSGVAGLASGAGLIRFGVAAAGVAPLLGAAFAAEVLAGFFGFDEGRVLRSWFAADALGTAFATPLLLGLAGSELRMLFARARWPWTLALIAGFLACAVPIFAQNRLALSALAFLPMVALVEALGFAGAMLSVVLLTPVALGFTLAGQGPLASGAAPGLAVLSVQIYLLASLVMAYALGAIATARRSAIAALAERERSLARSEARFRLLAENADDGMLRCGPDGICHAVSPAMAELLGVPAEQAVGRAILDLVRPADRAALERALAEASGGALPAPLSLCCTRARGGAFWLEARICPLSDPLTGVVEEIAVRARDISARKAEEARQMAANAALEALAATDALTGLGNRRQFDALLQREWRRAARDGSALGLLMIDVDFFKRYNDQYGHPQGDACLRAVAAAIGEAFRRPGDMAARYGGEEFAVLLAGSDIGAAALAAERLRGVLAGLGLPHEGNPRGIVTVSIGVADAWPGQGAPEELLAAADLALYEAKRQGRNRVVRARPARRRPAPVRSRVAAA